MSTSAWSPTAGLLCVFHPERCAPRKNVGADDPDCPNRVRSTTAQAVQAGLLASAQPMAAVDDAVRTSSKPRHDRRSPWWSLPTVFIGASPDLGRVCAPPCL